MNLETRKIEFVQDFLRINNEKLISSLEDLLRLKKAKIYEDLLSPMSIDQLENDIDTALHDSENNKGLDALALKNKYKK